MSTYLHAQPPRRNEAGYHIEEGIVVDDTEAPGCRPNSRTYGEFTRFHQPSKEELAAEEAAWAARSGPVYVIRPGQVEEVA